MPRHPQIYESRAVHALLPETDIKLDFAVKRAAKLNEFIKINMRHILS